jgi:hypothetical protein
MWATSVIKIKLLIVNNRPLGENSPNLVTLLTAPKQTIFLVRSADSESQQVGSDETEVRL